MIFKKIFLWRHTVQVFVNVVTFVLFHYYIIIIVRTLLLYQDPRLSELS